MKKLMTIALIGFISATTAALAVPTTQVDRNIGFIAYGIQPNIPLAVSTQLPYKAIKAVCTSDLQNDDGRIVLNLTGTTTSSDTITPGHNAQLSGKGKADGKGNYNYLFSGVWDAPSSHPSTTLILHCSWI